MGIVDTDALIYYSVACFVFTVCFLAALLISGKYANQLKRKHEFYNEKIAEKKAEETAEKQKREQDALYKQKLEEQEKKQKQLAEKIAAQKAAE